MSAVPIDKLPAKLLGELLNQHETNDPRVARRPGIGEGPAVIDMGDRFLVAKSDPITFATDKISRYAANVIGRVVRAE